MAHSCPTCGEICYCDIEDTLLNDGIDEVLLDCTHWCADDDTYDPDWNDASEGTEE